MLAKDKQPFEIQAVDEIHKGSIVNMYEVQAVIRLGKKGRPKKSKFTIFGKDALEAYMRAVEMLNKRNYGNEGMGSGVLGGD